MMAEIYRKATLVIAWLGNSDTYTELAFDHITKVADREVLQSLGTPTLHKASADPGTKGTRWEAIGKVFDRTYWNRSWIIQELVLPEHVTLRCGKYSTDWLRFAEASHNISTGHWKHYFDSRITARDASSLKASKATRNYGIPAILRATKTTMKNEHWATVLLYTLIRTRDCEASDLKDKVYSLLGLIQNRPDLGQIPPLLRPHYESNGPARAYVNVAIQLLRECEDLLVLSCAEGFRVVKLDGDDLPSWVPDWSVREPLGLRVTGYKRYEADPFFVSSDTKVSREEKLQQWPSDVNERELTVKLRGIKVDKISLVAESKLDIMERNPFPKLLRMLLRLPPTYEVTGEDRLEAFWRTLILNTGQDQKAPKADSALGPSFAKWFNEKVYSSKVPQTDEEDWNKLKEEYDEICVHDSKRTKNSQRSSPSEYGSQFAYGEYLRPFLTDEGYLGLGSQNLKEGDTVWVVPRSRVPLIFRERSHGKPETDYQCELVGGTYLHGFMDGKWLGEKALKDGLELDKMLRTIIIH